MEQILTVDSKLNYQVLNYMMSFSEHNIVTLVLQKILFVCSCCQNILFFDNWQLTNLTHFIFDIDEDSRYKFLNGLSCIHCVQIGSRGLYKQSAHQPGAHGG